MVPRPAAEPMSAYGIVRLLARWLLLCYYPDMRVDGAERVPEGPLLVAANHPNSLVDPIVLSAFLPRRILWMAKATLFEGRIGRSVLTGLGAIPVKRRHEGGDRSSSTEAIRTAADAVIEGGAVGIFPEGRSHDEQRLGELKTGVGRIAVLAARDLAASGGRGPVHVVPVALHFDSKTRFRSGALVAIGEPLEVRPGDSPEQVTEAVRRRLEDVLVHVDDAEQQRLLASVRVLIRRKLELGPGTDPREAHRVDREIALAIRRFHAEEPERVRIFSDRLQAYLDRLERQGLTLHALEPGSSDSSRTALALALSPVAAWGALHSFLPYQVARAIARTQARKSDFNMVATYGLWGGLISFPAAWLLEALACWRWWGPAAAAVFLVTAPPTALVARWVLHVFRREVGRAVDMALVARHPHAVRALKAERAWLWSELERWRALHLDGGATRAGTAGAG